MNISLQQKHRRLKAEQARQLARIAREQRGDDGSQRPTGVTAAGDERRLRGLPAVGRGVSGAIRGTSPHNRNFD